MPMATSPPITLHATMAASRSMMMSAVLSLCPSWWPDEPVKVEGSLAPLVLSVVPAPEGLVTVVCDESDASTTNCGTSSIEMMVEEMAQRYMERVGDPVQRYVAHAP